MPTSPLVIDSFELRSRKSIVVVQSLSGSDGARADWNPSMAFIKATDVERRRKNLQVRLMAFSDGGQPADHARAEMEETLKKWKMAIIIHELHTSFGGRLLQRVMNWRIDLTSVPAKIFSPIQVQETFTYMDLDKGEKGELEREIQNFSRQHPGHLALTEFVRNLGSNIKSAVNG